MFQITKLNEAYMQLDSDNETELFIVSDYFRFRPPDFRFSHKYQAGIWDGYIRMVNLRNRTLHLGLLPQLIEFLEDNKIEYDNQIKEIRKQVTPQMFNKWVERKKLPYELRDYQREGVITALNNQRQLVISPTGSGKSLIIYLFIRFVYENMLPKGKRILLIVPRTSLVEQMVGDFQEYGWHDADTKVQKIYSGQSKSITKPIVVSTWQSLANFKKDFFKNIHGVIVDEAHNTTNEKGEDSIKVIVRLMDSMENAPLRIGTTGTVRDSKISDSQLLGLFGDMLNLTSTTSLIDKGILSPITVRCVKFTYDNYTTSHLRNYKDEIEFIENNPQRMKLVLRLAVSRCKGTSIILFRKRDFGRNIFRYLKKWYGDKRPLAYIDGSVVFYKGKKHTGPKAIKMREQIRKDMQAKGADNFLLVASMGTFAEGINVTNVENIVFASPYKSKIKIVQGIGRGLRVDSRKDGLTVYDIVDMLKYGKRHFLERAKIYVQEGFPYKISKIKSSQV